MWAMVDDPDRIQILPYDPAWGGKYEEARTEILRAVGEEARSIEHIGSTAVPGLHAKPIIDILLALDVFPPSSRAIAALQGLGFEYLGEHGIADRHFFRKGKPRSFHLHGVQPGSDLWTQHIRFRDLLRAEPVLRAEYSSLKVSLAKRFGGDRQSYTDAKGDFIRRAIGFPENGTIS
jgi:GrpB-like predicted nucleotidyltransferase (UPF0157 family)